MRVTHVPEDVRDEEPSFWGNNLCKLEPTLEAAERTRRISAEAGLEIIGLGTYLSVGDLESTADAMKFARKVGALRIRVGVGKPDGKTSYADLFETTQKYLAGVEELSREYGVEALVESITEPFARTHPSPTGSSPISTQSA